jgi:Fe-S oxidoreductase
MYSDKGKSTIDSCRFCWMCRHICPVGNQTHKEVNTPRGRGFILSTITRGGEITPEIAETMYECCLCGACIQQCATGWDPTVFVREARTSAVLEDMVPEKIKTALISMDEKGNPFEIDPEIQSKKLIEEIKKLPEKAEVVLFLGCTAKFKYPQKALAAINLLKKAGIDFTVIEEEKCCGLYQSDFMGYVDEARKYTEEVAHQINETGAKTLVALCPSCSKAFKREYQEWNSGLNCDIRTITEYLAELVRNEILKPGKLDVKDVTYHDPCRLARDLEETEPSRYLIESMGIKLNEMYFNKEMTRCCGGELNILSEDTTSKISSARWQEAANTKAGALVVACGNCYEIFSKTKPNNMQLKDLIEMLWEACK